MSTVVAPAETGLHRGPFGQLRRGLKDAPQTRVSVDNLNPHLALTFTDIHAKRELLTQESPPSFAENCMNQTQTYISCFTGLRCRHWVLFSSVSVSSIVGILSDAEHLPGFRDRDGRLHAEKLSGCSAVSPQHGGVC